MIFQDSDFWNLIFRNSILKFTFFIKKILKIPIFQDFHFLFFIFIFFMKFSEISS